MKIDIIKHPNETDGKSTAIHAKILAPGDVTIYTYPCIPDYDKDKVSCFSTMNDYILYITPLLLMVKIYSLWVLDNNHFVLSLIYLPNIFHIF